MRRRAGGDHNHNASNHGYNGSAATSRFADDDNNDAHGRRLLIAVTGRGCVCRKHGPVGRRLRISTSSTEFDRPQAGGYICDALRILERALLRSGLPLPPSD